MASPTVDLELIFPPQWSPFQPFLSSPSLAAYLRQKGYQVTQRDWNVGFYQHFLAPDRLPTARRRLTSYLDILDDQYSTYRARCLYSLALLDQYDVLLQRVERLTSPALLESVEETKECVDALQKLLGAFSVAEPVIEVGTSSLFSSGILSNEHAFHAFVVNECDNPFISYFKQRLTELTAPRYFGLSIIGTEQIVPALTLCHLLKEALVVDLFL